ncbi:Ku protein [Streptomyces sp. enrichment culture]|uniref:non-homologous end joining protein Ku n=1 Tax=Streptomyces sp. enrichment culture TaxID=1795815 RepID=UPI003F545354
MRPVWTGAISFGLVTIPCRVLSATEDHSISFRQVHTADGGRIRYQKVCKIDGEVLDQADIGRGYEIARDRVVPVTDEELAQMPLPTAKAIEIVAFVPEESIDPAQVGDSYWLQPDGQVAAKPYKLLREALTRSDRAAIAKFAWHGRERLGELQVLGEAIALHGLRWPDEIRDPGRLAPPPAAVGDEEIDEALALMDVMTVDRLDDLALADRYRDALVEVIAAKSEHREPASVGGGPQETAPVVDLMAALHESVAKARAARGDEESADSGPAEDADVREMPRRDGGKRTPAGKAAAKPQPARRRAS